MKWTLLLFLLIQGVWGSTMDSQIVYLDGSQTNIQVDLKTEKTRLEWRQVQVPATCYRTVYQRRCVTTPPQCRTICRGGRCQRVCNPPRTVCRNVPVQVAYSCTRVEQRQVQVHDYFVEHFVNLQLNLGSRGNLTEAVKVTAVGEELEVIQIDRREYRIRATKIGERSSRRAGVKTIEVDYQLDFN